ncbi:MAG: hypothetical protein U9P73_00070 [Candidatus Cloacimonadota bacterium]|nr:hypothetical protein [Candidatus Cloacimonadota bacterium]
MRKFLVTVAIAVFAACVWAQTEIEENAAQDTINIEQAVLDTLENRIDPKLLLIEMNNFLDEKRKMENEFFLPHLIYKENFHLSSPFNLNMRIIKNGFSEIQFATGNLQTVQNNRNIYNTIYKRGNIFYSSWEYSLPVALTETYMGLGDIDMNNIAVSLIKGSIFGIPKFDMQLDYLGEKGIWQGYENEVIKNFHLHLSYDLNFAKIHFDNRIIDQTLPGEKDIDGYIYANNTTSNKENEYSVKVENNVINLGFKYKTNNYKINDTFRKERDLLQFLAQKKFKIQNHQLDISYEFISEDKLTYNYTTTQNTSRDDSYHLLSIDHDSSFLGFDFGNTGFYRDENNYQFNSELIKNIFHGFSFFGEYNTSSIEFYQDHFTTDLQHQARSRIGGGIIFNPSHVKIRVMMGQNSIDYSKSDYFEVQNTINLSITKSMKLRFEHWLRNRKSGLSISEDYNNNIMSYPEWQMSDLLELTYLLKHNNAIKLGLKRIYHSNYSYTLDDLEMIFNNDTENYDAYLRIQLTDRFEISVDAINLTNNKIMFINYDHPGTHFNFNVHWIFVN